MADEVPPEPPIRLEYQTVGKKTPDERERRNRRRVAIVDTAMYGGAMLILWALAAGLGLSDLKGWGIFGLAAAMSALFVSKLFSVL